MEKKGGATKIANLVIRSQVMEELGGGGNKYKLVILTEDVPLPSKKSE